MSLYSNNLAYRTVVLPDLLGCVAGSFEQQLDQGEKLGRITRHMLGLFAGQPGARAWRRYLSENAYREGAAVDVVLAALDAMPMAA